MGKLSPDTGAPRPDAAPDAILREAAKDILAALERLHASRTFANSQRLLTFLSFVVEATLRGNSSSLKETTIGVGLFHRDPGYDPKIDSIVRTQASRLRERLAEYYATEGALDPVVIQINRGSYVPVFDRRSVSADAAVETRRTTAAKEEALAVPVWRWRQAIWWVAAAAIAIGAVAFAYVATRPRPVPKVLKYTQLTSDGNPKWLAGGDASRLFLGTGTLTSLGIAQLSISRGEVSAFPSPVPNLYLLGSSTDGAELLGEEYPANTPDYPGRLWSVPVIGGLPRRVGAMLANDAAWSPDGTLLVYCNRGDLFLANSDGTEARKLASVAGLAYAPQVSPDGARIRFSVMDLNSRGRSLWEVTREGGDLRPLLPGWHTPPEEENGKWTADGKYYVFQSRGQIWALSGSSGFGRSLTVPSQLTDSPLSLSSPWPGKDGKRLFVVGRTQRGELSRYSGAAREFLPFLSGVSAQGVDFSRNGRSIAFVTYPEGVLWCSRTDGSQRVRLSNPPLYPIMPRWSPDGRQVVFWGFTPGKPTRLYRVGAKGGDVAALLPEDQDRLEDPNWSPDGDRIVFARDPSPRGPLTIQVLNLADGRSVVLPGSTNLASPRWSPDGRHLVAMRRDALGLMLFDFQTNKWSPLVSMPVGYPSWSRDGQYVYFLRVPDNPAVLRVRLSDRVVERVVDLKSVPMTGFLGPWLGLAPDGSPLVLRDWSSQDIYALEWDAR